MIAALVLAALLQSGGPHFSEDPDVVSTPGARQIAPATAPAAKSVTINIVANRQLQLLAEENKEDPINCRDFETTGTRFTTKKCLRKSQWDELARRGREDYESFSAGGAITGAH